MSDHDWNEYKILLIQGHATSQMQHAAMLEKLSVIEREIAVLKFKSGVWGTLAGTLAALVTMILKREF